MRMSAHVKKKLIPVTVKKDAWGEKKVGRPLLPSSSPNDSLSSGRVTFKKIDDLLKHRIFEK
jgi:hypothetical protein